MGIGLLVHGGCPQVPEYGIGVAATQTRTVARFSGLELAGGSKITVVVGARSR